MYYLKRKIKAILLEIYSNSNTSKIIKKNKFNVLIQINRYFSKKTWLERIKNSFYLPIENFNFIFIKGKINLIRLINQCEAAFLFDLNPAYLNRNSKLKLLYLAISGHNFTTSEQKNIKVFSSRGIASECIAEYTIAMVIFLLNNYHKVIRNKKLFFWDQKPVLKKQYESLKSFKIGILGVGYNGKAIAEKFHRLGCYVLGFDANIQNDFGYIDRWYDETKLNDFLNDSDIIIISLPLTSSTFHLINYNLIERFLVNKIIVNVSRGSIIKEEDLIKGLKKGILKGAVLDVFENEPLPFFSKLKILDNVILTPHISGNVNRFIFNIQDDFLKILANETNYDF